MKFFAAHLRWLNLPGALLLALLQRTPVVRVAATVEECVLASPAGAVLRAAVAAAASLGALHSLAGATSQVVVSTNSVNTTVDTPLTPVTFVTNFFPPTNFTVGSYTITGLPPGLTVPGLNTVTGVLKITNSTGSGQIVGTPTEAGTFTVTLKAWEFDAPQGNSTLPMSILFTISSGTTTGQPSIRTQPVSQITAVGQSVTFSIGVIANPAVSKYQWLKDGVPIPNANGASLTFANVLLTDAGNYFVSVTNSFGTVQSDAATLTVNATSSPPAITVQPQSQAIATGSTVVFTGAASSVPSPSYQWWRGSTLIAGATSPTLVLTGANVVAGSYTLVASNSEGPTTSKPAILNVAPTTNPGRLINLSILTALAAGETMTMGTVLGGVGTNGSKALLARAAGPSLTVFKVTNPLPDPKMALLATSAGGLVVDSNNDWGGTTILNNAFVQVGAFAYTSTTSKDAAIYEDKLALGNYTVQVSDNSAGVGTVIAELYDATPTNALTTTTPRLINVSVLKQIGAGTTLTAGFVIGGSTARTVLVRAIGPGIAGAPFNVPGTMADPQLALFNLSTGAKIAENDNWGGDPQITAVGTAVGAFKIDNAASKDAMLLVTLAPGNYTAQVSGVGGTGGTAIVEVYEVP